MTSGQPLVSFWHLCLDNIPEAGVKRIWGVAGDSLNAITESLRRRRDIAWMHVRSIQVSERVEPLATVHAP